MKPELEWLSKLAREPTVEVDYYPACVCAYSLVSHTHNWASYHLLTSQSCLLPVLLKEFS